MQVPQTAFERARSSREFSYVWTILGFIVLLACAAGGTFGWIKYFSDDDFAPRFDMINQQNAALQAAIARESTARSAEDTVLIGEQTTTGEAINAEIVIRTAEDALLLQLITTEIEQRTFAQQTLNNSLNAEILARLTADALAFAQLANLTARLELLNAYDVYALQQFMIKMAALGNLDAALAAEIAARIAADAVLQAQDTAQQAFITLFTIELAAETAARIAEDLLQMAAIDAILGPGIMSINNQSSLAHNFDFIAGNSGFTIGSGGTNIITITDHAIRTVNGGSPDPTTFDISVLADNNVVLTPGLHSLQFSLAVLPVPPTYARYTGTWVYPGSDGCSIPVAVYFFDAHAAGHTPLCSPPESSNFITDYGTGDGYGWKFPLDGGGNPYGTWLVRVQLTITLQYLGLPYATTFSMAICLDTRNNCVASPAGMKQSTFNWASSYAFATFQFAAWGMNTQDHIFKTTMVLSATQHPTGTGVYPIWVRDQGQGGFSPITADLWLGALTVNYEVTQLA